VNQAIATEVKYHLGYSHDRLTRSGHKITSR